ncbi:MAG: hypothetical protein A2583_06700 [Bdellovibrionales bacterium RIFOXYD1_FULL_53_11]|nr:MAG: hypothetical protein A2583_06700 [Bdellovibrionales bacterium RIFOXYD1_FULL_53_11]
MMLMMAAIAMLQVPLARAAGGDGGNNGPGNGGHDVALEFTSKAYNAIESLKTASDLINANELKNVKEAIQDAKVYAVEKKLCPENIPVCTFDESLVAKNHPEQMIIFINIKKWKNISAIIKTRIAIHEYLGIIGIEKSKYQLSALVTYTATKGKGLGIKADKIIDSELADTVLVDWPYISTGDYSINFAVKNDLVNGSIEACQGTRRINGTNLQEVADFICSGLGYGGALTEEKNHSKFQDYSSSNSGVTIKNGKIVYVNIKVEYEVTRGPTSICITQPYMVLTSLQCWK